MNLLAVESSCDESALALFDSGVGVTGDWVHSQAALHGEYGGVVPDLASREHLRNFPALLRLLPAGFDPAALAAVVVTRGPGLAGCLALGIALAKALALAWGKPLGGVNHLRGHLFSPFIATHAAAPAAFAQNFSALLPHLALVVSGGNTLLVELAAGGRVSILAQTVDDAAGEAFDKGAKLLGLPYPGGALIEKLARDGDPAKHVFPRGVADKADPRFSFSGLKTSLRRKLETLGDAALAAALPDICAGYQDAIVGQLLAKTRAALAGHRFASLGLSGGVANNTVLRTAFARLAETAGLPFLAAAPCHSGDNAAMIAFAAFADAALPTPPERNWALSFAPSLTIAEA
ncbi:MAG: tRNA (adenosine(37)-N6)-threonylcarbamoyltransferase complex transferase subunit TsaD [Puniceicoccales bacterium]|jgi:N6-L-threonylcarbamoyladenine synthase|nr:tRNA (adenosine(37)-N6)-threonylcarbamoyltransferase complex transferase subunit TsaD [Puniceicoccales bacterium]